MSAEEKTLAKDAMLALIKAAMVGTLPHLEELTMVLRRVCRFDFPKQWGALTSFLVAELRTVRQQGSESALAISVLLHNILKEQSTKRLIAARKETHQLGSVLMEPLGAVWCMKWEHMKAQQSSPESLCNDRFWKLSRHLDGSFLLLMTQGFAHLHEQTTGPQMIQLVKEYITLLLVLLRSVSDKLIQCPFFLRDLKSVLKWWALLMQNHPLAFAKANVGEVLQMGMEILQMFSGRAVPQELRAWMDSILKSSLQLLGNAFNTVALRKGPQASHQGAMLQLVRTCHQQFAEFIQRHPSGELCELYCSAALKLPLDEIREWLADPEDQLQGPGYATELHSTGEYCIRSLGQEPLGAPLIDHIAARMRQELSSLTGSDSLEVIWKKDALLSLLGLCQELLKPHLQFQQLWSFFEPIASLVPQLAQPSPLVLLPVRMCFVLRAWAGDIPLGMVPSVLQLLLSFLSEGSPQALRLAALSPLRGMFDRFQDHEGWAEVQGRFVDACLALLGSLKAPEVQWRCLNLVHLFLCEEASNGRYEATERSLNQLYTLWRQPEQGELLICHALLDVLRALVLMSCRSKKPPLPLSPPLLLCCLQIISDVYTHHQSSSPRHSSGVSSSAALIEDAEVAAGSLGDQGSAVATLFDSGSLLFLAVMRTVDTQQAQAVMALFPKLLEHTAQQQPDAWSETTLDLLVEFCALHRAIGAPLDQHYAALLRLTRLSLTALEGPAAGTGPLSGPGQARRERSCELALEVLQLVLAQPSTPQAMSSVQELALPLLQKWVTSYNPSAASAFPLPVQALLQVFGTWHTQHPQDFTQSLKAAAAQSGGATHASALLVACCRLVRPLTVKTSILLAALSTAEGQMSEAFWKTFLQGCDDVVMLSQRTGSTAGLSRALQAVKGTLQTKLPVATRSQGQLRRCLLPRELWPQGPDEAPADEVIGQWFFARATAVLPHLLAPPQLQLVLSAAPERVKAAFRASGA